MAARFGSKLKELRIHLCQKGGSSSGVRDFLAQHYVPLKQANPKFPILVRECSGVTPVVWARYEHGQEKAFSLEGLKSDDVLSTIKKISQ
ncbi:NADH dehydrogenase [ubiquinone] 1 alpha subcomplex subunit 2-like [Diaphorina citri]|uniref:NADH dehydrogenase [ubiquinone] 1 alpha subcomplex subunit 2 n=1 Tax=Diaphorina citri TaxID=121845 RepID=A0A1S3DHA7_DIACI|nr:NADH dehydrogenase [ubiquinone] 1 alpha subcomplex subunit 2-like [Diaphorina citri]KAI5713497.1 hypothetical protein M8J76_000594 [Diaphorina citri]KAI5714456.1 hypothetical protein M8J77_000043 [Diaphorina citri]